MKQPPGSFIIGIVVSVIDFVHWFSLYELIRRLSPQLLSSKEKRNTFADIFVLSALVVSGAALLASRCTASSYVLVGIVILAIYRIIDVETFYCRLFVAGSGTKSGLNKVASTRRTLTCAFVNFAEITLWLTASYIALNKLGQIHFEDPSILSIYREVLSMMMLNSTGNFENPSKAAKAMMVFHSVAGFFMTVAVLGFSISSLTTEELTIEEQKGIQRQTPAA